MKTREHKNKKEFNLGFTVIEVMIAVSIFSILMTVGMGAALDAINQNKRSQNMRTAMDNLNFVMEDMARNIRLGSSLHCGPDPIFDTLGEIIPQDCISTSSASNKLVFYDLNDVVTGYVIVPPYSTTNPNRILKYKVDPAQYQVISPPELVIDFAKSGFTVRGAQSYASGDRGQPSVVIRLAGHVLYKNIKSNFAVESTVALRTLDI